MTVHPLHPEKTKPAIKIIALVRVSTADQAEEGRAGIDRQVEAIRRIVQAEPNATLVDTVFLKDVSGSDVAQTDEWCTRILPRLDDPSTHLAVAAVDRLLRPDAFDFSVLECLQGSGTNLYTPAGPQDPKTVAGFLVLGLGGVIGGLEKLQIKERVFQGKEVKRKRGEHPQSDISLPTGIKYDRKKNRWYYTEDADKVRRVFDLLVRDGVTCLSEICRRTGIKTGATLRSILSNPIYRGERVIDTKRGPQKYAPKRRGRQADRKKIPRADDEIIRNRVFGGEDQEPQLVPDEVWYRAQEILAASTKHYSTKREITDTAAPYSGVLYSASAGADYHLHRIVGHSIGARGVWYECQCRKRPRKERCNLRGLPVVPFNAALDNLLVRLTADPWFVDTVLIPQFRGTASRTDADLEASGKMLKTTHGKLQRLQDAYVEGRLEPEYYNRKLKELRATRGRQVAERERIEARAAVADSEEAGDRLKEHWETKVGHFDPTWPLDFRVGFIQQHFSEIIISETGVDLFVVRVPQGPEGLLEDLRVISDRITWEDLLGYNPFDKTERLAAHGLYTSTKIAERLGLKDSYAVNYLLGAGVLGTPEKVEGGVRYWTEAEALEAEESYKRHTAEPEMGRWGLPKKERYYRPDVAEILGMTEGQVRYAVKKGRIPKGAGVDAWARPFWGEVEIEGLLNSISEQ